MNNYLLSIDPSIKNTGFTLWEKQWYQNDIKSYPTYFRWKPILINSYSFKKYNIEQFKKIIINKLDIDVDYQTINSNFDLIIERGTFHSKNGIGYETQEHLRGFIAGQFNKLLTKDMLISPSEWKKWYIKTFDNIEINLNQKWFKELSLSLANHLIITNNWNITISNHDEADSLLIGWYYLNKENK